MRVVHHYVHIFFIELVPHIIIENTSLVRLQCLTLLDVKDKLISILSVVGHQMILLDQTEGQSVGCSLGVIPDRTGISREVTNFFGVCHSCVTMDTYILSIGIISEI